MGTPTINMSEKKVIALAIDATEYAEHAFDWYIKYLHHAENALLAIHVPDFDIAKAQKEMAKGGAMKEETEKLYSRITELEEKFQQKMTKHGVLGKVLSVPSKQPGHAILDTIKEEKCFAIVMGTRGGSALKKALTGSVSDHVVKHADIPVILVHLNNHKK